MRLLPRLSILVILVSLVAEFRSLPTPDVAFYLYATGRILDGARLYVDVVEVNPPLVFAMDVPAVLVSRWLHIPDILAYRGFVVGIAAISLALSQGSLRTLCAGSPAPTRGLLNFLLVLALFAVPGEAFGQREHLMFALVLPYLLSSCVVAAGHKSTGNALLVGFLAGLGLALKPYFVVFWAAVELWLMVKRPPAPFLRRESLSLGATLLGYVTAVWLVTPEYLQLLRLLGSAYARYMSVSPFATVGIEKRSAVVLISLLAFVAFRTVHAGDPLTSGLAVGSASLLVAAALQRKGWWYQFYPSVGMALVLLGVMLARSLATSLAPVARLFRYVSLATVIFVVGTSFSRMAKVIADPRSEEITGYPGYEELEALIARRAKGRPVMIWSFNIQSGFPLVPAAGGVWGSRFPSMWLVPALYWDQMMEHRAPRFRERSNQTDAERFIRSAMAEDLRTRPPALLIVLIPSRDTSATGFDRLDLRSYFAMDPEIAQVLKCFAFVRRIGVHEVFEPSSESDCRAPDSDPE
jgi:hypothetical protein